MWIFNFFLFLIPLNFCWGRECDVFGGAPAVVCMWRSEDSFVEPDLSPLCRFYGFNSGLFNKHLYWLSLPFNPNTFRFCYHFLAFHSGFMNAMSSWIIISWEHLGGGPLMYKDRNQNKQLGTKPNQNLKIFWAGSRIWHYCDFFLLDWLFCLFWCVLCVRGLF